MAVATSPRMFSGTSSNISIMADGILIADAFCGKVTKGDSLKCAMVSLREGRVFKVYKVFRGFKDSKEFKVFRVFKDSKVNY